MTNEEAIEHVARAVAKRCHSQKEPPSPVFVDIAAAAFRASLEAIRESLPLGVNVPEYLDQLLKELDHDDS